MRFGWSGTQFNASENTLDENELGGKKGEKVGVIHRVANLRGGQHGDPSLNASNYSQ